jgi:YjbE family integral membrane protein
MILESLWAITAIIMIDIVLAGDNALVIGMAAQKLEPSLRQRAIFWGTIGAIMIRLLSVVLMTYLLLIPGLRIIGGLALVYIGWRLAFTDNQHTMDPKNTFWAAIGTIVLADAVMGIDNALGIAAAANGNFALVIFGLLISIPIIIFGSSIISKIITKYPDSVFLGSYVLFVVAIQMILREPAVDRFIDPMHDWSESLLPWLVAAVIASKQYYRARIRISK